MKLTGKEVAVDFYLPLGLKKAPVVVVAHGFFRSRLNMAGWGSLLASNGFITAIPDLPAWADHERNGQAVRELFSAINSKTVVTEPEPTGTGALMVTQWVAFVPFWRPRTTLRCAAGWGWTR